MKVAVACKSILLQKSLELFLKDFISTYRYCDFMITDRNINMDKPLFLISKDKEANISVPFSKSQIILETKAFYQSLQNKNKTTKGVDFTLLEKKIELLSKEFTKNIIKAVREHYEQ